MKVTRLLFLSLIVHDELGRVDAWDKLCSLIPTNIG